jgi:hypothetical protein
MRRYHIVTIYNDAAQLAAMRATFVAAGFDDGRARFTPLDNRGANRFDPYAVLAAMAGGTDDMAGDEPCVILCHQDARLNLGDGVATLDAIVDRLDAVDPSWAVLGNAGVNYRRQGRRWLDDPDGAHRSSPDAEACMSLDENFLVLRRGRIPRPTPGLSGFHLYATDLVLNAALAGRRSYVVPFLLTHLSGGDVASAAFAAARAAFESAWADRLLVGIVNTTCAHFVLSRRPAVRWLLHRWRVRAVLAWCGLTLAVTWRDCVGLGRTSSLRLRRRVIVGAI